MSEKQSTMTSTKPSRTHPPPYPDSSTAITLDVSGIKFKTLTRTLTTESPYLSSYLSSTPQPQPDGSIFLDADPTAFTHILRYLRSGNLPFLYNKQTGFDEAMYSLILHESRFLGIEKLASWIAKGTYRNGVQYIFKSRRLPYGLKSIFVEGLDEFVNQNALEDVKVESCG